ncbi:MAG: hypothetical protein J7L15_02090 [Clostridiales bacterium]|nr:hypothetical protein [Clostridiales bacterium]
MKEKFKIKKINKLLIIFLLIISSFAYFHVCQAAWEKEAVDFVFGWFFQMLASMAGGISALVINGIIGIASYNGFINQPQIIEAWKIVRDFCNMFFILILLVIAFASILRLENYSMKRWLPKVVIMAVLINFSRTIVGVLIDASQIVMLTFVNAFVGTGSNFVGVLQIKEFLTSMGDSSALTAPEVAKGYAFATIFLIVSVIVLLAILVVLVMRVIFLWIYVALSPLAFLMMAFPGGQKYASQYWGDFTKYLINGPVLAFFLWLALSVMQAEVTIEGLNKSIQSGSSAIMGAENFMSFILAIAFMVGGLMMSSQIGGMGASWGSGMVSKAKNTGIGWGKNIGKMPGRAAGAGVGAISTRLSQGDVGGHRDRFRGVLGSIGSARLGGLGKLGINQLATNTLVGMGNKRRAAEEDANKKIRNIANSGTGGNVILNRIANSNPVTPSGHAERNAARNMAPSSIENIDVFNRHLANMNKEDIQKISRREWARIGDRTGIAVGDNSEAMEHLEQNRLARGAFNTGLNHGGNSIIQDGTLGLLMARDKRTGIIPGNTGPLDPNLLNNPNRYRLVDEEERKKERGDGNLSLNNKFARGDSNTLAVDLDAMGLEELKENANDEFKDIKGVNVSDPGAIKAVAEKMVQTINDELGKISLKAPHERTGAENRKIENLHAAKKRFENPDELDNISLVNSSAHGYKGVRDVINTQVHEEIHRAGVTDEGDTNKLTQHVIDTKQYSKRDKIAQEYLKSGQSVDEFISNREKKNPVKRKSVDDLIADENREESASSTNNVDSHGGGVDDFKANKAINQIIVAPPAKNDADAKNLLFLFKQINKSTTKQLDRLGGIGKSLVNLTNISENNVSVNEVNDVLSKIKSSLDS